MKNREIYRFLCVRQVLFTMVSRNGRNDPFYDRGSTFPLLCFRKTGFRSTIEIAHFRYFVSERRGSLARSTIEAAHFRYFVSERRGSLTRSTIEVLIAHFRCFVSERRGSLTRSTIEAAHFRYFVSERRGSLTRSTIEVAHFRCFVSERRGFSTPNRRNENLDTKKNVLETWANGLFAGVPFDFC